MLVDLMMVTRNYVSGYDRVARRFSSFLIKNAASIVDSRSPAETACYDVTRYLRRELSRTTAAQIQIYSKTCFAGFPNIGFLCLILRNRQVPTHHSRKYRQLLEKLLR